MSCICSGVELAHVGALLHPTKLQWSCDGSGGGLNFLSLFSGIGGIDLGLERAGMRCVGQVEIDPFCRRVLAKHWPGVRQFSDVRELVAWMRPPRRIPSLQLLALQDEIHEWAEDIELIAGGFPCQDISNAGNRVGINGGKSGLWSEFRRLICTIRPRVVLVENVAALLVRGIDRVLGDLDKGGYDAEWDCIPAAAVGAPHRRDRLFVVAYAREQTGGRVDLGRWQQQSKGGAGSWPSTYSISQRRNARGGVPSHQNGAGQWGREFGGGGQGVAAGDVSGADRDRRAAGLGRNSRGTAGAGAVRDGSELLCADVSNPARSRRRSGREGRSDPGGSGQREQAFSSADADSQGLQIARYAGTLGASEGGIFAGATIDRSDWWAAEPAVDRMAHGVPNRVDRLRSLGNAVVPQVAEWIGRRILAAQEVPA